MIRHPQSQQACRVKMHVIAHDSSRARIAVLRQNKSVRRMMPDKRGFHARSCRFPGLNGCWKYANVLPRPGPLLRSACISAPPICLVRACPTPRREGVCTGVAALRDRQEQSSAVGHFAISLPIDSRSKTWLPGQTAGCNALACSRTIDALHALIHSACLR